MGVEPTMACSAQPITGFEDRGIHRDTSTPTGDYTAPQLQRTGLPVSRAARKIAASGSTTSLK